mgnify:CR=1 FL=1
MANGKSGRSKRVNPLATIIGIVILVVASFFGIEFSEEIPTVTTVEQKGTQPIQDIEGQLVVHMIDVGQADCFLLVQDGVTALVDCGTRSTGKDAVAYLQELGVTNLDYVIGTHPHDDHMGGMYDVITNFEVGTVIIPDSSEGEITANWYIKLISELSTGNYTVDYPEKGDVIPLGDATMQVLSAETDVGGNTNNYSIVLKVSFGQMDMIMTGDAETEIEEMILESGADIDAEILKVGHHGSDTSSSEAFLDAVSPEYGLISCKVGNKYEHPIKSTMEELEERKVEIYRTDECGSVIMTVTTDDVTFNCEPGDYLSGIELEERVGK